MKKAIPRRSRPRRVVCEPVAAPWGRQLAAFDRRVRRSNHRWKTHIIRLDSTLVNLIANDRTIGIDQLNRLRKTTESDD